MKVAYLYREPYLNKIFKEDTMIGILLAVMTLITISVISIACCLYEISKIVIQEKSNARYRRFYRKIRRY